MQKKLILGLSRGLNRPSHVRDLMLKILNTQEKDYSEVITIFWPCGCYILLCITQEERNTTIIPVQRLWKEHAQLYAILQAPHQAGNIGMIKKILDLSLQG